MGVDSAGRYFVGYIWMCEHMSTKYASVATSTLFIIDASVNLLASIYFRFISKHYLYFFAIPTLIHLIVLALLVQQPESPRFYYSKGDYAKTREVLTEMGHRNKTVRPNEVFEMIFQIEKREEYPDEPSEETRCETDGP